MRLYNGEELCNDEEWELTYSEGRAMATRLFGELERVRRDYSKDPWNLLRINLLPESEDPEDPMSEQVSFLADYLRSCPHCLHFAVGRRLQALGELLKKYVPKTSVRPFPM